MLSIIERDLIKKPRLGGWRNKLTGIEYLNADSQTGPPPPRRDPLKICSRKVQTLRLKDKECQSTYDQATQMWRRDCYIPSISDKHVSVRAYETYDEMQTRLDLDGKARRIQRCYRSWRILKFVRSCARLHREMREDCARLEIEKVRERGERMRAYCDELNDPRDQIDLDTLIAQQERAELANLHDSLDDLPPRARNLRTLEAKRRAYLAANERMRALRESKETRQKVRFLSYCCRPRRWSDGKGRVVEMVSLRNQAAEECWRLYEALRSREVDRMEVLIRARISLERHDCALASKFRELLDREILLRAKSVDPSTMRFLRKRIVNAYLHFLKTSHNCTCVSVTGYDISCLEDYEFREPLDSGRMFCASCEKLLARDKFPVATLARAARESSSSAYKCRDCIRIIPSRRYDLELKPYVNLLRLIRESELNGGIVDLLSPRDLRHLLLDIWHGRSILSECASLLELRLPRYDLKQAWSPWNCVALTEVEQDQYVCLDGDADGYFSGCVLNKIRVAHIMARKEFGRMMAATIDDSQSCDCSSVV